ncbi:hypothetical protein VI817_002067 [Penicillium citrinum]|uniref:Uncharacterized protein n=1 Tax=Penicillium hetheringtonii TaxID=911720 RepID=A0AAD6DRR9_9EURO|nr:hypothetical protein N7450_005339 [Penicillium hetheringtonii]KAK5799855.1 hypothetical protein VI817_002067 [Penicillium citrinum]
MADIVHKDIGIPYRVSTPVGWFQKQLGLMKSIHSSGAVARPAVGRGFMVEIPAESVNVPMLEVERTGLSTAPPTWTALPRWTMNSSSVFNDKREAYSAEGLQYNHNISGLKKSPIFSGPGLRYIPSQHDTNIYRSVVIEGLPPWVSIHEILSRVEGGKIESVTLLDTERIMHGYPTMLIKFVLQSGAQEFLRRTHGALFLGYWPTQVRQVGTPTYVLGEEMDQQINQWGRTRCLKVHSEHLDLRGFLRGVLDEEKFAEWIEFTQENVLAGTSTLHFTSIKMAIMAYNKLRATKQFRDADLEFSHDPCAVKC